MASSEGRRSFLLGITLNELGFIMFFLLMIVSASTLEKTKQQLEQETLKKLSLQTELVKAKLDSEENFKRLQLLESRLMQASGYSVKPSEQQLNELFARLQEIKVTDDLLSKNAQLNEELQSLQRYQHLVQALEKNAIKEDSLQVVEQLLQQADVYRKEQQLLQGRVAYMQKKLKGNGLDHPPCWADPQTGAVEYLYTITLFEQQIKIDAAWPEHRKADMLLIPGARNLVGQSVTPNQLQQRVKLVFNWSKQHECRHFVRIKDDQNISKKAFKRQLLAVENYFYKYLLR